MAFLNNDILDDGLNELLTCDEIWICSDQPTTYAEATDLHDDTAGKLGLGKYIVQSGDINPPSDRSGGGREVVVESIENGDVTHGLGANEDETATHWAMIDSVNQRLLASQSLNFPQVVTDGNKFNLTTFSIGIPGPVQD
jgi:hypothetical protein